MKRTYLLACSLLLTVPALAQTQSTQPPAAQPQSSQPQSAAAGGSASRGSVAVQQGQTRAQKFDQLDKNHDGMISRDEAQASPDLVVIFPDTDANGDGGISVVEFQVVPLAQPDGTQVK